MQENRRNAPSLCHQLHHRFAQLRWLQEQLKSPSRLSSGDRDRVKPAQALTAASMRRIVEHTHRGEHTGSASCPSVTAS